MNKLLLQVLEETVRLVETSEIAAYEAYVELTNMRQSLMEEVQDGARFTTEEKDLLKQILKHDRVIMLRMQDLKQEAESGLQRISSSKKQKETYGGNSISYNSFMFDKKN